MLKKEQWKQREGNLEMTVSKMERLRLSFFLPFSYKSNKVDKNKSDQEKTGQPVHKSNQTEDARD